MKASTILIPAGFVAVLTILGLQTYTIQGLRADMASLQKDLRISLEHRLAEPANLSSEANQESRDQLELIKLRHQVRELNESLVDSHARERMASVRSLMRSVWPTSNNPGPWKLRPEWKGMESQATNQYAQAMSALAGATNEYVRFLCLDRAAKMSLAVGRTEEARQFATDMLLLDEKYSRGDPEKANGDVVHNGHMVLGLIALEEGQTEEAKQHLLEAGKSTGSPVLGSFGPNMGLAKALLEKGEQEAVLQYFKLCRDFWGSGKKKLDEWTKEVYAGRIPDFGASLIY